MKNSVLQFTTQYVNDNKSNIEGNIAEHLILTAQSQNSEYYDYFSEEEIEKFEKASSEVRAEMTSEIDSFIKDNFDFDISEFDN